MGQKDANTTQNIYTIPPAPVSVGGINNHTSTSIIAQSLQRNKHTLTKLPQYFKSQIRSKQFNSTARNWKLVKSHSRATNRQKTMNVMLKLTLL